MEEEADEVVVVVGELVGCLLRTHSVLAGWLALSIQGAKEQEEEEEEDRTR